MTFRLLTDQLHNRLADQGHPDVRPAHGFAVGRLVSSHGATTVELAGYLGVTKQGAGHIIGELEHWGYVERTRHPTDGRSQLITATAKGRDLVTCVNTIWQDEEARWAGLAGIDSLEGLRSTLQTYIDSTGDERPPLRPVW
ncbi:MarR family winged helix-turn-helix transcriptional regulator [Streptomyces nodosus]